MYSPYSNDVNAYNSSDVSICLEMYNVDRSQLFLSHDQASGISGDRTNCLDFEH